MSSWLPESWNDRLRCARCSTFDRMSPTSATCASTWLRSRAVRENSEATATAVPKVRAATARRPSTESRMVTGARPGGIDDVGAGSSDPAGYCSPVRRDVRWALLLLV